MHNDTLQQEMLALERMIHDLKQSKYAGTMLSVYSFTDSSGDAGAIGVHKITFEDGQMPIITEIYSGSSITIFSPEGNTQYYYSQAQGQANVYIFSTRKILSVEYIGT